jgi:hypothetical protein
MTSNPTISGYTIKKLNDADDVDKSLLLFLETEAEKIANLYDNKFNWRHFDLLTYMRENLVIVCFKDDRPVGVLLARLLGSIFDPTVRILFQDLLYSKEQCGRAAYLLLMEFIDFGSKHANHIITCKALNTNIKGKSLERLGFVKLEELYRMECK